MAARPRGDADPHSRGGQAGVRRPWPGRARASTASRPRRRQQAHAVLPLRQQGRPVPRGARGALRANPPRRARARSRTPRPAEGARAADRLHLELLPRAPRNSSTLLNSENLHKGRHLTRSRRVAAMHSPLVEMLRALLERGARGGCSGAASIRCSSTSRSPAWAISTSATAHTLSHLRPRPPEEGGEGRAPGAHGGAGAGGADGKIDRGFRQGRSGGHAVAGASAGLTNAQTSSWPGLSLSCVVRRSTPQAWMPGSSPGMTRSRGQGRDAARPAFTRRALPISTRPDQTAQRASTNMTSRSRGIICPRFAGNFPPSNRRAQGMPDARCTRGLMRSVHKKCAHEHTGQRRTSDIPCAMALRLITCSPRRTALLPPSRPEGCCLQVH